MQELVEKSENYQKLSDEEKAKIRELFNEVQIIAYDVKTANSRYENWEVNKLLKNDDIQINEETFELESNTLKGKEFLARIARIKAEKSGNKGIGNDQQKDWTVNQLLENGDMVMNSETHKFAAQTKAGAQFLERMEGTKSRMNLSVDHLPVLSLEERIASTRYGEHFFSQPEGAKFIVLVNNNDIGINEETLEFESNTLAGKEFLERMEKESLKKEFVDGLPKSFLDTGRAKSNFPGDSRSLLE